MLCVDGVLFVKMIEFILFCYDIYILNCPVNNENFAGVEKMKFIIHNNLTVFSTPSRVTCSFFTLIDVITFFLFLCTTLREGYYEKI